MKYNKKKFIILGYVFIFILSFSITSFKTFISPLNEDNSLRIKADDFTPNFTSTLLTKETVGEQHYSVSFDAKSLPKTKQDHYMLLFKIIQDIS